jgi:hypothetical protein
VGADLVTNDPTIGKHEPVEVLGDSAYATGDMLDRSLTRFSGHGWCVDHAAPWAAV